MAKRRSADKLAEEIATAPLKTVADPREFTAKESGDTCSVLSVSDRIRTVEDAFKFGGYDPAIWQVHSSECKAYQCCIKNAEKRPEVVQLWAIKLTLRRRVTRASQVEAETILDRIRRQAPKYPKLGKLPKPSDPHLLEIALFDVHFGKLAWRCETGQDYDLPIAKARYVAAVVDMLGKASSFPIEKILLPIGQDFFHIDNKQNQTTAGTPQDVDGRYPKVWAAGKLAAMEVVEMCAQVAPVEIIYSPGNHDELTSYHLCEYLDARFHDCDRVTVDTEPKSRKYVAYGPVVLGFTHGNEEKQGDLVSIMLHEARELMATRRTLEIHTGHFHKAKETRHVNTDTHAGGVRVRTLPSLSGTDRWHYSKGYVGAMQAAESYLWSKRTGYVGHFSANVEE
jgi:hypothetical protein